MELAGLFKGFSKKSQCRIVLRSILLKATVLTGMAGAHKSKVICFQYIAHCFIISSQSVWVMQNNDLLLIIFIL